jgi:hypothetical protein
MIIGLISDTHGLLRPEIARVFAGVGNVVDPHFTVVAEIRRSLLPR